MFTLLTFTAPAHIVIPTLICTMFIVPVCIMWYYETRRKKALKHPAQNDNQH